MIVIQYIHDSMMAAASSSCFFSNFGSVRVWGLLKGAHRCLITRPRRMLDRLVPCLEAQLVLSLLDVLLFICFLIDRALYWLTRRTAGRIYRFLIRLEFRWYVYLWYPLQECERRWKRHLEYELSQVQIE